MATTTGQIVRLGLRDQVLAVLRQRLVSGEFQPGSIYSAQAVAAELGVSGSPVREAMLTLVHQGLLSPIRNRGFLVLPVTDKERADVFEMRVWLEAPAMEKLAGLPDLVAGQAGRFRALAGSIVDLASAGDVPAFLEHDREFHIGLTDLLDNPRLTAVVGDLRDRTRLYGLERLSEQGALAHSAAEHGRILDALLAGDAARTRTAMIEHLQHVVGDWADGPSHTA